MAKKMMTLEEKLEEAIIKEISYEVPDNWVWINSLKILDVAYGKNLSTKKLTEEGYPVFGANGYIGFFSEYNINTDKVLISCRGAYSGTINFANKNSFITNNSLIINQKDERISNKFLFYMLNAMDRKGLVSGTAQPQVTVKAFEDFNIVLPPLKEQQRIVDKIESLFEKLDKAKELIEEARDDFRKRKSAILEKAFRGELTKDWRKNNFIEYKITWSKKKFDDVATVKSNLVSPSDFLKYPHIAPDNIEKKSGKLLKYRTIEEDGVKSSKHRFYPGQIIYSKIRPYLSKVILIDFEGLCSADMYPIETELYAKYLYYYMLSDTFVDFASNAGSRSVLPKINQKELGKILVPVCDLKEQKEIVRILDKLLEEESKVEGFTALEDQIELIKKSILAKAFRGELGTNCEEDESALELLKEILNT